jgi:hypothetical protein
MSRLSRGVPIRISTLPEMVTTPSGTPGAAPPCLRLDQISAVEKSMYGTMEPFASTSAPVTLGRMEALLGPWEEAGDPRAVFLACYRLMTLNMLEAVERNAFHDPEWVERLVHHFADYYFRAVDQWEGGSPDTPAVWRLAFRAARQPATPPLRQLLLGVNAHINYDLIFTLTDLLRDEWPSLGPAGRMARRADHRRVNGVIHRSVDAVQDTVLEPRQPFLATVDAALCRLDEWVVARLIRGWRETVWRRSVALLDADCAERYAGLCCRCESEALRRGVRILGRSNAEV